MNKVTFLKSEATVPELSIKDMSEGQIGVGKFSKNLILKTGEGWVYLDSGNYTKIGGSAPAQLSEILPKGTKITIEVG